MNGNTTSTAPAPAAAAPAQTPIADPAPPEVLTMAMQDPTFAAYREKLAKKGYTALDK